MLEKNCLHIRVVMCPVTQLLPKVMSDHTKWSLTEGYKNLSENFKP